MKHLRWVPLAFFAGQHGFAVFAPYAALMLTLSHYMNRRRAGAGRTAGRPARY